jgi:AraC family transcriptional regulator
MPSEIGSRGAGGYAPSTLGRVQSELTTKSFRLTTAKYRTRLQLPAHSHQHASVTAVLGGGFSESFSSQTHICTTQSVLIKPAGATHANVYGDTPTSCLLIAVIDPPEHIGRLFERPWHLSGGKVYSLALALRDELSTADDLAAIAAEGLVLEMVSVAARQARLPHELRAPPWLKLLRDHLQKNCLRRIDQETIAEISGMHPVYAARLFRRHYGCAPMEFVRCSRIDWAVSALLDTAISVGEISLKAGFADQSHFTRTFTRRIGRTPGEIRRSGLELAPLTTVTQS